MVQQLAYNLAQEIVGTNHEGPTFAGINGLVGQANGSLLASWLVATDDHTPIDYLVYILPGIVTSAVLFASVPALIRQSALSAELFRDGNNAILIKDQLYSVGVRAQDALGNMESNVVMLTAVSTGVLTQDLASIAQNLLNNIPQPTQLVGTIDQEGEVSASIEQQGEL